MTSFYLIGSLRNPVVPEVANTLEKLGFEVFADWFAAGEIADDSWQAYETARGRTYLEALKGYAANHVFQFDLHHLHRCDGAILVYPAGKSAHLELGYMAGLGKKTYILLDKYPDRWDVMLRFSDGVFIDLESLIKELLTLKST